MLYKEKIIEAISVGPLGLIPLESCMELGNKMDAYLVGQRQERESEHKSTIAFSGYQRDSYIISTVIPRFGTREGKGLVIESIKGDDLYIMVDICNYNLTYSLFGMINCMSSDDHFQDLGRVIATAAGRAYRISIVMPLLYKSHQHGCSGRESLDYVLALKELVNMRAGSITTLDTHGPGAQNTIPLQGSKTVQPIYQFLKYLLKNETDLQIDSSHITIISPDEGGTERATYFANMLGLGIGMFYKRRDYMKIAGGCDPTVAHEFLEASVEGKDVLIIDDMVSSSESTMDVAKGLKHRKTRRAFMCTAFGLFTGGLTKFDEYYDKRVIDRILTINLIYQILNLLERPHYTNVDISKYIVLIIDGLNHGASLSDLLTPTKRINRLPAQYRS